MSKWEKVKLGEVCSLITDGTHQTPTYVEEGYMFLSSKNVVSGKIDWDNVKYIPKDLHNKLYERLTPQIGDILLAKNGTTGIAAVVDRDYVFDIYVSLALLRPQKGVILPEYLLFAINNPITKRKFNRQLKGIGVPNLHLKNIKETTISLPPLNVQKQIAKTLDTATELLAMRKQQLAELDNLIKSIFYDMFGDPVANEKGWEVSSFGELSKVRQGLQIAISKRKKNCGENCYKYITVQYLNGRKEEEYIENPRPNVICVEEDILMTRTGNTGMVITGVSGVFHNNFFLIDYDKSKLLKAYLIMFLNYPSIQANIIKRATTSTIPDLNHGEFYKINVPLPPMSLQTKFAENVTQIEAQKALAKQVIDETQYLFDSLMSKYFD